MKKLFRYCDTLWQDTLSRISKNKKICKSKLCNTRKASFEPLESRNLLAILTWAGGDGVWSIAKSGNKNWLNGLQPSYFSNGDVVKFSNPDVSKLNVKISGEVKPSQIIFSASGYNISTLTSSSTDFLSANNTTLTIEVDQAKIDSDVIATISAPIMNPSGGITKLLVDYNKTEPDGEGNLYPTGTLILKGHNSYGNDNDLDNTLIKGYSFRKTSDNTLTYTGGVLVAGSPDALPKNSSDVFRHIDVMAAGTLAVENDGTLNGTNGKWTNDTIPTLFSSNPKFEGNETLRSNFGIWVDEGKSFEYTHTIPGNSGGSTNLNENFVKLGAGTLTLSGDNRRDEAFGYPGTTSVNKGTLITPKPEALPHYGDPGQVKVKNTIPIDPDVSNMNKFFECSC